jgi:DNA-binding MarR family transcriptional regulator
MNDQTRQRTVHQAIETLQKLSELLQRRRIQLAKQVGLTEQQWRVIEEIMTEHFMPSLFARNRDSSAAAVSKIIRQLTEKQLINVTISQVDGRQRRYVLTAKGKKLMEQLRLHRRRAIDAIWTDLDIQELKQFNRFSSRLMQSIETFSEREE